MVKNNFVQQYGKKITHLSQQKGKYGNGIFSINNSIPVKIFLPYKLLIDVDYLEILNGEIIISDLSEYIYDYDEAIICFLNFSTQLMNTNDLVFL